MDCPKCLGKLETKELRVDEMHDVQELRGAAVSFTLEYEQCFSCGGVWFDRGELEKYTTERLTSIDSPSVGNDLDRAFDRKQGKCPKCGVVMKKVPWEREPSITLDVCGQCGGTWLDATEIDRVERSGKEKPGFLELILRGLRFSGRQE